MKKIEWCGYLSVTQRSYRMIKTYISRFTHFHTFSWYTVSLSDSSSCALFASLRAQPV